ncbi:MAG: RpiB/LacA/LacB family sugar-phosphate isomerase [Prevotellaceae bacterium]|jgi:ribose 5-phosphate isomerase B|nr:RpiB/LacA/LacB family sugar-phosphate isomerase [Prevotellaceae bacterium]
MIGLAADHAGFELKEKIHALLTQLKYDVHDFGTSSAAAVDYPDFAHPLANALETGKLQLGIACCGTGNGMAITLNKHAGVRAGLCWNVEISSLIRRHNDANVCVLPARFVSEALALEMVKIFLTTTFEGERHRRRVDKIPQNK